MNYLDNEYSVPVIIGQGKTADRMAVYIFRRTGVRPFIFASKFTLTQHIFGKCRKLASSSNEIIADALLTFASVADGYYTPLLIYCTQKAEQFIKEYSQSIESAYICVSHKELLKDEAVETEGGQSI